MASNKRPSIPLKVKLQVWTEAAGRCQFRGCNKPLWYDELTLNKTNFAKMAHIIGASKKGPRGGDQSEKLAKDPSNIMLACGPHHDEIDDGELSGLYPVEELRKMKKEHTDRVRLLLHQKAKKTRPLILTAQIEDQNAMFSERSIQSAILPDYPDKISDDWYKIEFGVFDRKQTTEWQVALAHIDKEIESVQRSIRNGTIDHLSVFGLAAQPLLMHLGKHLGDKAMVQVFEPRRTDDQDKKWSWDEEDGAGFTFESEVIHAGNGKDAILLLALSDFLSEDKYSGMVAGDPHIFQLSIDTPVQGFLTKKSEKAAFIQSCRLLLNEVQRDVGKDCTIHVLPAMPASLAVEFGRLLQPTKDPKIWVYERIGDDSPTKILELI